ncbi:MAG TPA: glycosyltransferase family 4 protein, partial [Fimbriimonadaceae bacterium]|nr:glycosyltransferase family 4 protein [Fimbriimonadaceae bacterium]
MPSRVVVVNDFAHVQGGAARVAIDTAIGLASRIREVVFLAGCGPADSRMAEAGVQVEVLDLVPANRDPSKLRGLRRGLWDRSVARAVEALLPDPANSLVHFHTFTDCLTASAPWAAERSGAAVLYTLHDYNFGCPYGGFYNYTLHRPCGRVGLSMRCLGTNCNRGQLANRLWRLGRLQTQRLRGVPSPTSGFVFISSFQRRRLEPYLPPESPRFELSNPVSIERSDPSDPGATDIFTFVGRLTPEKGPVDFANAAREARVRARFVGDGPLAEHVREASPEGEMAGWQHEDEVQRLMRASRAIVMPSRWFEGQPLVA